MIELGLQIASARVGVAGDTLNTGIYLIDLDLDNRDIYDGVSGRQEARVVDEIEEGIDDCAQALANRTVLGERLGEELLVALVVAFENLLEERLGAPEVVEDQRFVGSGSLGDGSG